jgi:hypothetical protein
MKNAIAERRNEVERWQRMKIAFAKEIHAKRCEGKSMDLRELANIAGPDIVLFADPTIEIFMDPQRIVPRQETPGP